MFKINQINPLGIIVKFRSPRSTQEPSTSAVLPQKRPRHRRWKWIVSENRQKKMIEVAHVPKNELFTFYQKSTSKVPSHSQPFSKDQTQKLQPHSSLSLPHLPAIGPCPQGLWWHASSALPGRISSENWGHRSIPITKYLVQRCVKQQ